MMESLGDFLQKFQTRIDRIKAQQPVDLSPKTYACPLCQDAEGHFALLPYPDEPEPVEQWVPCSCVQKRRIAALFESSRITPEMQNKRFDSFEIAGKRASVIQAFEKAIAYVDLFETIRKTDQNSIALLGQPGSGKTHLLMAVANHLIETGVPVLYFPWVEGWTELRGDLDKLKDKIRQLQTAPVLFIDDLYKGRDLPTQLQSEQLFAIVNYRYLNCLPMLISSERSMQRLNADEGIGSRIAERCRDFTVHMAGAENYRIGGKPRA